MPNKHNLRTPRNFQKNKYFSEYVHIYTAYFTVYSKEVSIYYFSEVFNQRRMLNTQSAFLTSMEIIICFFHYRKKLFE